MEKLIQALRTGFDEVLSILPIILVSAIISIIGAIFVIKKLPHLATPPNIVVFDVIKLTRSQQQYAQPLMGGAADTDILLQLRNMGSKVNKAIRDEAGPNAVIIVKQAVVGELNVPDITDRVLRRLELPVDVPGLNRGDIPVNDSGLNGPNMFVNPNALPKSDKRAEPAAAGSLNDQVVP